MRVGRQCSAAMLLAAGSLFVHCTIQEYKYKHLYKYKDRYKYECKYNYQQV